LRPQVVLLEVFVFSSHKKACRQWRSKYHASAAVDLAECGMSPLLRDS
jgi:hypothetical protein